MVVMHKVMQPWINIPGEGQKPVSFLNFILYSASAFSQ